MPSYKHLLFLLILITPVFGASWFTKDVAEVVEEEVYLSFRYQGVIDVVIVAYYDGDNFYLPVTELFDLFAINYELDPKTFSVSGFYIQEDVNYNLDFSRRFALVKDEVYSISASDFLVKEIDFYLAEAVFKEVFDLDIKVNLSRLTIDLKTPHKLPIVTRYSRRAKEELRRKHSQVSSDKEYTLLSDRNQTLLDGGYVDYSMFNTFSASNQALNLSTDIGGEFLFGDVQGSINTVMSTNQYSINLGDLRWRYASYNIPWFETLTLGRMSTIGLTNNTLQGMYLTNNPLVSRRSYDTHVIDGTTDPEAEIELYQDGRMVEVTKADDNGYYRFLVPLNYGLSDFKIRIYAKQGQVIELDQRVQIPFNFLPQNELRYGVLGGRLESGEIWSERKNVLNSNISYGVNNWLTAMAGVEYNEGSNQDHPVFFSKISARVYNDILVNLDVVPGNYTKVTSRGIGPNTSSVTGEYTYYNKPGLYNVQGYKHSLTSSGFYPFQVSNMRFTSRGSFTWTNKPGENSFNISADVNQFLAGFRLRYGLTEKHTFNQFTHLVSDQVELGAVYTIPRIPRFHPLIRGTYLRGDISYKPAEGSFGEFSLQYIKQSSRRLKLQSFLTYYFQESSVSFQVGLTWDFDKLRSSMNVQSRSSTLTLTQSLRGSVGLDRNNGEYLWDNRQQVGRSGVTIRMFIDDNNSGTYDVGEEVIPGNALTIEGASSRQIKKSGITRLTQLQPYHRYNFHVNEARVNNPMLVASMRDFSIVTDPNRYKQIDVPFFTTGVIDGRVDRKKGGEFVPISGLRMHIKQDESDFEITVRTFSDGSFYSMEIPPGSYELWVDEGQLEFLGMTASPEKIFFTIDPGDEGNYAEELNFLLQ